MSQGNGKNSFTNGENFLINNHIFGTSTGNLPTILGNGDRYFVSANRGQVQRAIGIDSNGNVTLVNDATVSDSDRTDELNFINNSSLFSSNPFLTTYEY